MHDVEAMVEATVRAEHGRVMAVLVRRLGDPDLAEDALQQAYVAALRQWPTTGPPDHPRAWLVRTATNKAIDRLRRSRTAREKAPEIARLQEPVVPPPEWTDESIPDERLRLIFTCCHPALALEARVALTLRWLCGLSTPEIAHAFLVPQPTMAQRLVRAKKAIRDKQIPYEVPAPHALPERLDAVLAAVGLVFREGYLASEGEQALRTDLCEEAIRLARALDELMPGRGEVEGLLALLLLQHSRRGARTDLQGALLALQDQDRERWDRPAIAEGLERVERALARRPVGAWALQAAIAALHARAPSWEETDWAQIAALYEHLYRALPTPVVRLNQAVAQGMAHGPAAGLALLEGLDDDPRMARFHRLHAARAELLRRAGRLPEAAAAYGEALALVQNAQERAWLETRLRGLAS